MALSFIITSWKSKKDVDIAVTMVAEAKRKFPALSCCSFDKGFYGKALGGGTDGIRVANYHPWNCLWWLVTRKRVGGLVINGPENRLK